MPAAVAVVAVVAANAGGVAAIGGFLGATGIAASVIGGAIVGAVAGGVTAAVMGKDVLKGAIAGGLVGGVAGYGIGSVAAEEAATLATTAQAEGMTVAEGGTMTLMEGTGQDALVAKMALGENVGVEGVTATGNAVISTGGDAASSFGLIESVSTNNGFSLIGDAGTTIGEEGLLNKGISLLGNILSSDSKVAGEMIKGGMEMVGGKMLADDTEDARRKQADEDWERNRLKYGSSLANQPKLRVKSRSRVADLPVEGMTTPEPLVSPVAKRPADIANRKTKLTAGLLNA